MTHESKTSNVGMAINENPVESFIFRKGFLIKFSNDHLKIESDSMGRYIRILFFDKTDLSMIKLERIQILQRRRGNLKVLLSESDSP